jgi:L-lactate dehydrogenase complex protein LldG
MPAPVGREHGDRETFLARARGAPPPHSFRPTVDLFRVPSATPARPVTDLVERFAEAVTAVSGHVRRIDASTSIAAVLAEVCATEGVRTAVISRDPECEGVTDLLAARGVDVRSPDGPGTCASVDLGVTGAAYGVALTGSLVVAADRAGCRTASLLPPVHVAIVRVGRLLATPEELFRHLPRRFPDGMPSNLVLITGPSRSADIELQLTLGVHGPRSLWVVLV